MSNTPEAEIPNTSSTPAHSSMVAVGRTNTQLVARTEGLSEEKLTQIASKLLRKTPALSFVRKKIKDDFGEKIGDEISAYLDIAVLDEIRPEYIDAALRMSPAADTLRHVTRLAMHKRIGSDEKDRSIRIYDCSQAIRHYPEFVVYLACRIFWEGDKSEFFPTIKALAEVCELLQNRLTRVREHFLKYRLPYKPVAKPCREEESPAGSERRKKLVEFINAHGDQRDFANTREWSNYALEGVARRHGWKQE